MEEQGYEYKNETTGEEQYMMESRNSKEPLGESGEPGIFQRRISRRSLRLCLLFTSFFINLSLRFLL